MLSMLQTANQQHYIPIVDAAIAILVNDSDVVRKGSFKLPPVRAIDVWHDIPIAVKAKAKGTTTTTSLWSHTAQQR